MFDTINDAVMSELETWVLSSEQLETVFNNSRPGEVIVYAVGDLAYECETSLDDRWEKATGTRTLTQQLQRDGRVELKQKRLAPGKFEYQCQKK